MDYKQITYEIEDKYLSPYATKSKDTKGRAIEIASCPLRTDFQRDRDRIIHCKAFRRLKHKTQVFLSPEGDHYRTRLTHTLEVSQIARTISRALRLNEDLTEAIALGHDLGHTPFGHAGEYALQEFTRFLHNEQSKRIVEVLENNFCGMNLTHEVVDGILNHKLSGNPATLEGKVVSYADRIAYINHDIDDAVRAGIINEGDIPRHLIDFLGASHGERINNMISDIVANSYGSGHVKMSDEMQSHMTELREFMFRYVYADNEAKDEESKAIELIKSLFRYYNEDIKRLPVEYQRLDAPDATKICDFISTMSDRYAISLFENLFVPRSWKKL